MYFNELAVDTVFWMLHTELDRYWYARERSHSGEPPLEGKDRVFQPLRRSEGAWYGGGRRYGLSELTGKDDLPYRYDRFFRGPPASVATHGAAPPVSAPNGLLCQLHTPLAAPTIN